MSTIPHHPQSPAPPAPPAPARPSSNIVAIVLLLLALIVVVSGIVVWGGLHYLSRGVRVHLNEANGKQVSVQTPIGSFEVKKDVNEAQLGLPIYPGATRLKDEDSATINMNFGGEQGVHVVVAKFETTDNLDKVRGFYQDRVGGDVTKFTEKDSEGKTVFEIKRKNQERIVTLKSMGGGTRIDLVRVDHGREESAN
jgi:hypothetical protein